MARMPGEDQPRLGASMIPYVTVARSAITRTWPTGSKRRGRGAFDSGMKRSVRRIAASPIGRLIRKIERQPTEETSAPPTIGPSAIEMPNTAPQTPTAWARSRGSVNVLVMIDIATGFIIEPPTAWSTRKATRNSTLGARLHRSEPSVNTAETRSTKVRLRPNRSAVEPENINRLAITSV